MQIHIPQKKLSLLVDRVETLMQFLLRSGLPVASSCKGDGVCAKCKIRVIDGMKNFSQQNITEDVLRQKFSLSKDERISCQIVLDPSVNDDVTISTGYW